MHDVLSCVRLTVRINVLSNRTLHVLTNALDGLPDVQRKSASRLKTRTKLRWRYAMVKHLDTFTVYDWGSNKQTQFSSLREAQRYVEGIVGNRAYRKPFPHEQTYLYGPEDGTTSHMIRQDTEFKFDK